MSRCKYQAVQRATEYVKAGKASYVNPGARASNGARSAERKHIEHGSAGYETRLEKIVETVGWQAICKCGADVTPCTVLDPFGGSGTTGLVADRLGRNAILIDRNADYAEMARQRIAADAPLMEMATEPAVSWPQSRHPKRPEIETNR